VKPSSVASAEPAALALDQGAHRTAVARPLDVIAFPVPGHEAGRHLNRALVNGGHVRQRAAPVLAPCARHACLVGETQLGDEFVAQLAPWHGVDGAVDRFVRDVQSRIIRVHPAQSARNLLRRPALGHQRANPVEQHRTALQLDRSAPPARQRRALGTGGIVALAHRVPRHFARHCGGRPIESSGNCPKTQSLIAAPMNLITFVHRQLAVVSSHAYTLPNRGKQMRSISHLLHG